MFRYHPVLVSSFHLYFVTAYQYILVLTNRFFPLQVNIKEAAEALDLAVKTTDMIVHQMQTFLPKVWAGIIIPTSLNIFFKIMSLHIIFLVLCLVLYFGALNFLPISHALHFVFPLWLIVLTLFSKSCITHQWSTDYGLLESLLPYRTPQISNKPISNWLRTYMSSWPTEESVYCI